MSLTTITKSKISEILANSKFNQLVKKTLISAELLQIHELKSQFAELPTDKSILIEVYKTSNVVSFNIFAKSIVDFDNTILSHIFTTEMSD